MIQEKVLSKIIAVLSGKGGAGKTMLSTNMAYALARSGRKVTLLDCDVEEPNSHIFISSENVSAEDVKVRSPQEVNEKQCHHCGVCAKACKFNAITMINNRVLFFPSLCRGCGACMEVCPAQAIIEKERVIGRIFHGSGKGIDLHYGLLDLKEARMTVPLIKEVKRSAGEDVVILDSPPGTACPAVETVKDADVCVLIGDPTPFGIHDFKMAEAMCRQVGKVPLVVINRSGPEATEFSRYIHQKGLKAVSRISDSSQIARMCSNGQLVAENDPDMEQVFLRIGESLLSSVPASFSVQVKKPAHDQDARLSSRDEQSVRLPEKHAKEILVISGKGGTGKTSLAASFAVLSEDMVVSDCDVDASNLPILLNPTIIQKNEFSGGQVAWIDKEKCTLCGLCGKKCKFDAVKSIGLGLDRSLEIDPLSCEGCGLCGLVCPSGAVKFFKPVNGTWYISDTSCGPFTHADLLPGQENTGRLVALLKGKNQILADQENRKGVLIDGSPGTGCPVVSSLSNVDYAVLVTEPSIAAMHDLERIIDLTGHFKIACGIVINKSGLNDEYSEKINELAEKKNCRILGEIPYDSVFNEAQSAGQAVTAYSSGKVSEEIKSIWNKVVRKIMSKNKNSCSV